MNITSTITVVEIIWTVPAVVALALVVWMAWDVIVDARTVLRLGWNGTARVQALGQLRTEILTVLAEAILVALGIFAMTQPSGAGGRGDISPVALAITLAFIGLPSLDAARAIGSRIDRERVKSLDQLYARRKTDPPQEV